MARIAKRSERRNGDPEKSSDTHEREVSTCLLDINEILLEEMKNLIQRDHKEQFGSESDILDLDNAFQSSVKMLEEEARSEIIPKIRTTKIQRRRNAKAKTKGNKESNETTNTMQEGFSHMSALMSSASGTRTRNMFDNEMNNRIYSIGHSNHPINRFLEILLENKVTNPVDIRGSAKSIRNFQFNEEALKSACKLEGITYRHCPQRGNKKTPIHKLLETKEGSLALKQLADEYQSSDDQATAIMCSEHDNRNCHRRIVSQRLYDDHNVNVTHIKYDGTSYKHVEEKTLPLFNETLKVIKAITSSKWQIMNGIHVCDYESPESNEIAGFDLEGTIIKTKSGEIFPEGKEDWEFWSPEVVPKLKELHEQGKKIVVVSNQGGVKIGCISLEEIQGKVDDIQKETGVPMLVMIITEPGYNRKPNFGSWETMIDHCNSGKPVFKIKSFYCGDAAGRHPPQVKVKDFSNSDLEYAQNIGIRFFTPERMFKRIDEACVAIDTKAPTKGEAKELKGLSNVLEIHDARIVKKNKTKVMKDNASKGSIFKLEDEVNKMMFAELEKVSSKKEIHAYMSGVAEHDHSRLFDEVDTINAANLTKEICCLGNKCKEKDFPKLFQLSYQWIYDTGAS